MSPLLQLYTLKATVEEDARLREPEKYWFQLTSYDLDKLKQLYELQARLGPNAAEFKKEAVDC